MFKQYISFLLLLPFLLLSSCNNSDSKESDKIAKAFASNYFNWNYVKCVPFVTKESQKYLKFRATNVTESDLEILRSTPNSAEVEVDGKEYLANDSALKVKIKVFDFCYTDTIGRPAKFCDYAEATLLLVKRTGKWKVVLSNDWPKMAFPQQSELQDHDPNLDE